ncbi:MAG: SAM-dependent methyltransferase [Deltaproteobacteria bacterium]|nr:MAG: SAM-dependent methyltransferase [Deltaproteobacteria bacterium]
MKKHVPEETIAELADYAAAWTGFSRDAILPDAIRRAVGRDPDEMLRRARRRDPAVVHSLCQAVSVGETFFFRHQEHFKYIASQFLPKRVEQGATQVRAWSAGCATGEEAYSLAACLLEVAPWPPGSIEVLGTDLIERNLTAARAATYGAWSKRASAPILHPLCHPIEGDRVRIDERVRKATRFENRNLLDEPPAGGPFDLIFCRNVLVYFSAKASRTVVAHLVSALAPWGVLFFGPMDVTHGAPHGLVPGARPEEQIWRRPDPDEPRPAKPARRHAAPAAPPPPSQKKMPAPPEPVALHLRALRHIDRGERHVAERALTELCQLVPDYVPGLVERALLKMRNGEQSAAAQLMREVLRRTEKLGPEEMLAGPEPLPVRFYRESADNFLRGAEELSR